MPDVRPLPLKQPDGVHVDGDAVALGRTSGPVVRTAGRACPRYARYLPLPKKNPGIITSMGLGEDYPGTVVVRPASLPYRRRRTRPKWFVFEMQDDFLSSLKRGLSGVRFGAYKRFADERDEEALARYVWNIALCEALYPSMHCLEVALRNTLHHEAASYFRTEKWLDPDHPSCVLSEREQRKVRGAKRELQRRGRPPVPDRVVAELTFGFWTSLLSREYEQRFLIRIIKPAFPDLPKPIRTRRTLAGRFNEIRRFRNRIFHHEPIWKRGSLVLDHQSILEAIGWICPALRQTAMAVDRFPAVHKLGSTHYLEKLKPLMRS